MSNLVEPFFRVFAATAERGDEPVPCMDDLGPLWADIEQRAGVTLPGTFKQWRGSHYTDQVDIAIVRLPPNRRAAPLAEVRQAVGAEMDYYKRPRRLGLIPFGGEEASDAGPLCFDPRGGSDPETWPIRYWEPDAPRGHAREIGPALFSSFGKLPECCTSYLERESEVMRARPDDMDDWFQIVTPHIREFFSIDPTGAGGPGRRYWEQYIEGSQF